MKISFDSFAAMVADLHVEMTKETFISMKDRWGEYSCSLPSGVVPGKHWLRHDGLFDKQCKPKDRKWLLCWYSEAFIGEKGKEQVWINMLPIRFIGGFDPKQLRGHDL